MSPIAVCYDQYGTLYTQLVFQFLIIFAIIVATSLSLQILPILSLLITLKKTNLKKNLSSNNLKKKWKFKGIAWFVPLYKEVACNKFRMEM